MKIISRIVLSLLLTHGSFAAGDDAVQKSKAKTLSPPANIPTFAVASIQDDRLLVRKGITKLESVEQTYVVTVPVRESVDGKEVVRERKEERTRVVRVPKRVFIVETYPTAKLSFEAVDGTEVTAEQATTLLKSMTPVLLVPSNTSLDPYFREIMKRKTLIAYGRFGQR